MMGKRSGWKKGSITVFSALCMVFVASALFLLLEAARVAGLERYAQWKAAQGAECAAAEYQPYLWEEFQLLALDGGYGADGFQIGNLTAHIEAAIEKNLTQSPETWSALGLDFFHIDVSRIYEPEYLLMTDSDGEVFLDMAAACMKETLPREAARAIYERCQKQDDMEENTADVDDSIADAKDSMETARQEAAEQEREAPEEPADSPLETVAQVKNAMRLSTLGLVLSDSETVSTAAIDVSDALLNRTLSAGTAEYASENDWYRKILAVEYAKTYFSHYGSPKENHVFSYELEYLLGGKGEERENLEAVVNRLLLYRSAANITYLLGDREKMAQAQTVALALAGFTGNAAIVKTVQIAVVGAWAFLESVQDVRALLRGGKIALVKNRAQWTLNLTDLASSFSETSRAKECDNGLTYADYLVQMLFFVKDKTLAYRMMDVMEQNLAKSGGNGEYADCRMDRMIVRFDYEADFSAEPLFASLAWTDGRTLKTYSFRAEGGFRYLQ